MLQTPFHLTCMLICCLQVHTGKYAIPVLLIGAFVLWAHDKSRRAVCILECLMAVPFSLTLSDDRLTCCCPAYPRSAVHHLVELLALNAPTSPSISCPVGR